ncbi:unnamed protein product, partial [Ixodes persulcatus]
MHSRRMFAWHWCPTSEETNTAAAFSWQSPYRLTSLYGRRKWLTASHTMYSAIKYSIETSKLGRAKDDCQDELSRHRSFLTFVNRIYSLSFFIRVNIVNNKDQTSVTTIKQRQER